VTIIITFKQLSFKRQFIIREDAKVFMLRQITLLIYQVIWRHIPEDDNLHSPAFRTSDPHIMTFYVILCISNMNSRLKHYPYVV